MKKRVFTRLKPKATSFGFNDKELEGVADQIANNLGTDKKEDEVTDEQIDAQIDAAIPFLRVAQANSNRVIQDHIKKAATQQQQSTPPATDKNTGEGNQGQDDEPEWFRKYREENDKKIQKLQSDKISEIRKTKIETLLKDTGTFGKSILKAFEKMSFESDEDFEAYVSEVTESLKEFDKERTEAGLSPLTNPIPSKQVINNPKKYTDAEVDAIVDKLI